METSECVQHMIILDSEPNVHPIYTGRVWTSDSKQLCWLDIPKNASKTLSNFFQNSEWRASNLTTEPELALYKSIVILRDPIDRWRKSVLELVYHQWQYFKNIEQWFEDRRFLNFGDIHLQRQTQYLHGMDSNYCVFIKLDQELENKLATVLGQEVKLKHINATEENQVKLKYKDRVEELCEQYHEQLHSFYAEDLALLEYLSSEKVWV